MLPLNRLTIKLLVNFARLLPTLKNKFYKFNFKVTRSKEENSAKIYKNPSKIYAHMLLYTDLAKSKSITFLAGNCINGEV